MREMAAVGGCRMAMVCCVFEVILLSRDRQVMVAFRVGSQIIHDGTSALQEKGRERAGSESVWGGWFLCTLSPREVWEVGWTGRWRAGGNSELEAGWAAHCSCQS